MFFKKKIFVEEYCTRTITPYFSGEWNDTWEALRRTCNDDALTSIEAGLYYNHLRALFINLMLIGIAKNCSMDTSINAHIFTAHFLKQHNHSDVNELIHEYSQAF